MKPTSRSAFYSASLLLLLFIASGCVKKVDEDSELSTSEKQTTPAAKTSNRSITQEQYGITLPLLDAFFADSSFKTDIKREIGLSDDEVNKLQQVSREETANLQEISDDYTGTTASAQKLAEDRIAAIIGNEKGAKLASYLNRRWSGSTTADASTTDSNSPAGTYNEIPSDTRVVVNAPAYRMDIFKAGALVRSYTVAIGVPEFPLPVGMRKAGEIIFNPTWTPPDESWVEKSKKIEVGKKVAAGSKLNPLGIAKIPIGMPSLIHGGKREAQLGNFGSHGCVGLTDAQMKLFSQQIAMLAGDSLDDKQVAAITKNKTETKSVKLEASLPIELRYETIVAEDGNLHIYRDVYDRGTNTEENVKAVLEQYGVKYEQLSDTERTQIGTALSAMSNVGDTTKPVAAIDTSKSAKKPAGKTAAKTAKAAKPAPLSKKVRTITIAALAGKGYPAPILEARKPVTAAVEKKR